MAFATTPLFCRKKTPDLKTNCVCHLIIEPEKERNPLLFLNEIVWGVLLTGSQKRNTNNNIHYLQLNSSVLVVLGGIKTGHMMR